MENDKKFQAWMRDQIRLAGQELIRRADQLDLGGLDGITNLDIKISIPTHGDTIVFPGITLSFDVLNKKHLEWFDSGKDPYLR